MNNLFQFCIIIFCFLSMQSCEDISNHPSIIGHRGWRGMHPENTMIGFKKAMELGVDVLELDIVITKDSQVVISHEPWFNLDICDIDSPMNIYQMDYSEIKKIDCGSKTNPRFPNQHSTKSSKPLLEELLKFLNTKNSTIQIAPEIKSSIDGDRIYHPNPKVFSEILVTLLDKYQYREKAGIQSFDVRVINYLESNYPDIKTILLIDENEDIDSKIQACQVKPDILSPYFELLNEVNTKKYQNKGYLVYPWTVNQAEDMQLMLSFKVDGIITDYPKRLKEIIEEM